MRTVRPLRTARAAPALLALLPLFFFLLLPGGARAGVALEKIEVQGKIARLTLTYTNDTDATHSIVKITCGLPGATARRQLGITYISNHLGGGVTPGYTQTRTLRVPIKKKGDEQNIVCLLSERKAWGGR